MTYEFKTISAPKELYRKLNKLLHLSKAQYPSNNIFKLSF